MGQTDASKTPLNKPINDFNLLSPLDFSPTTIDICSTIEKSDSTKCASRNQIMSLFSVLHNILGNVTEPSKI